MSRGVIVLSEGTLEGELKDLTTGGRPGKSCVDDDGDELGRCSCSCNCAITASRLPVLRCVVLPSLIAYDQSRVRRISRSGSRSLYCMKVEQQQTVGETEVKAVEDVFEELLWCQSGLVSVKKARSKIYWFAQSASSQSGLRKASQQAAYTYIGVTV